jgi:L-aspartate oxidase
MKRLKVSEVTASTVNSDVVVIGSGVAGLATALALAPRRVTLLTKVELVRGSASVWAQGGVAAALGKDDAAQLHTLDTLSAGDGLCDPQIVSILTEEGPQRIRELIALGAAFDRDEHGELRLGREGAHSRRRILHANGDATGGEMVRALAGAVRDAAHITVAEGVFAEDLVLADDGSRVLGVLARAGNMAIFHRARAVVLASGGLGQLYQHTTNPTAATGDGLAMAARAGARLADLEMVQFHPTALAVAEDPLPLVTEALRGEGAWLLNAAGKRFMPELDARAELAPRDIVARAIWRLQHGGDSVVLDASRSVGDAFPERFPTVYEHCRRHGIDPRKEPIPVTPAAHYAMGGVATDAVGQTSIPGLWACGEVASSGVHGANRLASNSLLEGLVFGRRVAYDLRGHTVLYEAGARRDGSLWREESRPETGAEIEVRHRVRALAWERVALVRRGDALQAALGEIDALPTPVGAPVRAAETRNLVTLARLVCAAALAREESRGGHFREDFPKTSAVAERHEWTYQPGRTGELPLAPANVSRAREIA